MFHILQAEGVQMREHALREHFHDGHPRTRQGGSETSKKIVHLHLKDHVTIDNLAKRYAVSVEVIKNILREARDAS